MKCASNCGRDRDGPTATCSGCLANSARCYQKRKTERPTNGRCMRCPNPCGREFKNCKACRDKHAARSRKRYRERASEPEDGSVSLRVRILNTLRESPLPISTPDLIAILGVGRAQVRVRLRELLAMRIVRSAWAMQPVCQLYPNGREKAPMRRVRAWTLASRTPQLAGGMG